MSPKPRSKPPNRRRSNWASAEKILKISSPDAVVVSIAPSFNERNPMLSGRSFSFRTRLLVGEDYDWQTQSIKCLVVSSCAREVDRTQGEGPGDRRSISNCVEVTGK